MGLKIRDPKFNMLCKIGFIFVYKMPTHGVWRSIEGHSGTSKSARITWLNTSIFQKTKTKFAKLVSETGNIILVLCQIISSMSKYLYIPFVSFI